MKFLIRTNGLMNMKNKGNSKKNKTFTLDFWIYLAIFIALIGGICYLPTYFTESERYYFYKETGTIGDTIGGTMGPFVAIAAAILTFLAFWVQFKANEQQRKDIALERFESNFFELLHFHQEITNELLLKCNVNMIPNPVEEKGRDVFQLLYENTFIKGGYNGIKGLIKSNSNNWNDEYLNSPIGFLDHYFRFLYRILKYIDDSQKKIPEMTLSKRYEYTSIVRATLSQYELVLLFYNCLSTNGNKQFKLLIERYAIFNNLRVELLAKPSEQNLYASKFKDSYLASQDKNRYMSNEYKKGAFVFDENED